MWNWEWKHRIVSCHICWGFVLMLVDLFKVTESHGIGIFSHTKQAVACPLYSFFYLDVEFCRVYRASFDYSWEQEERCSDFQAFCMSETALLIILAITETALQSRKTLNNLPTFPHG